MPVKHQQGLNLISIIIAIVIISFSLLILTTLLYPRNQQSAELIYSTKSAELGSAVMDEIIGRNFDENSGPNGGLPECTLVPTDNNACTPVKDLGPENGENERTLFNDVDDFHGLSGSVSDVLGNDLATIYPNFTLSVQVFYDANLDGNADNSIGNYKRVVVDITDPAGQHYVFSMIRGNF